MLTRTFRELGRREYDKIALELDVASRQVHLATAYIQDNLNPYPARAYWGTGRESAQGDPNVYHTPDIMITRQPSAPEGALMVEIFSPITGWLRVNPVVQTGNGCLQRGTEC